MVKSVLIFKYLFYMHFNPYTHIILLYTLQIAPKRGKSMLKFWTLLLISISSWIKEYAAAVCDFCVVLLSDKIDLVCSIRNKYDYRFYCTSLNAFVNLIILSMKRDTSVTHIFYCSCSVYIAFDGAENASVRLKHCVSSLAQFFLFS
jgi:hypothetical protein